MLILVDKIQKITDFVEIDSMKSNIVAELKIVDEKDYPKNSFRIDLCYTYYEDKLEILDNGVYYLDNDGNKHYLGVNELQIGNIIRSVVFEYKKFIKDRRRYLENNSNMKYEVI